MAHFLFRRKSIESILKSSEVLPGEGYGLKKNLRVRDLTAFGIAAIVGAGIFSTIGQAATHGGPAVSLLFVFTAIACGFSAMCYARFASVVPISGSAYTYAYVSFGELIAWIIGWDESWNMQSAILQWQFPGRIILPGCLAGSESIYRSGLQQTISQPCMAIMQPLLKYPKE